MLQVSELVQMFSKMQELHGRLRVSLVEEDGHLPSKANHLIRLPDDLLGEKDGTRWVAAEMLCDMYHDSAWPRTTQSVVCIQAPTARLIEELNDVKAGFKDYVQVIKAMNDVPVKSVSEHFCREPLVAKALQEAGQHGVDLQKIYRRIPVYPDRVPEAVSYSWSKGGRGTCKLKPKEIVAMINESGIEEETKTIYHEKLARSMGSGVSFFTSRPLSMHQVMNIRFPGEKKWNMNRCSLPLFMVSGELPSIRFKDREEAEGAEKRVARSDNRFSESVLLLPALGVYMRQEKK